MHNPYTFLFLSLLLQLHISAQPAPPQYSPSTACKTTLYPKLCRSILSTFRSSSSTSIGYSKFSVKQCIKKTQKLSSLINHYLKTHRSFVTHEERSALEDCRQLFELTGDYLECINGELKRVHSYMSTDDDEVVVGRVHTLLSAVVTNLHTCYDGLVDSGTSLVSALSGPVSDASELYSVALGLVTHAVGRRIRKKDVKGSSSGRFLKELARDQPFSTLTKVLHGSKESQRGKRFLTELVGNGIPVNTTVTVSPWGNGNFTTIGDAIAFAPNNSMIEDGYFVINIKEGYYQEYVVVPKYKKNIMLLGDGINRTVITGNRSVIDGWTTFNSATFAVFGERFVAIDITFQNTAGPEKHQAVAVRNNADLSTFYHCSFEGYQDTLYVHSLRQFYRQCNIYGTVDFIFGNSAAVFQNCNLFARKPMANQKNAFTAQGRTDPNQNTGISIQNCTIQAAPDLEMNMNSTLNYLGRPWKVYSRTVYMQSYIGSLINPVGWLEWNGTVGLDTLYYGEYENYGPGANTTLRVQWPGYFLMNASQAMNFTVYNLTMGDTWLPNTSIPFSGGLLW